MTTQLALNNFVLTVDTTGFSSARLYDAPEMVAQLLRRIADSMEDVTMEPGQYRKQRVETDDLQGVWEWSE